MEISILIKQSDLAFWFLCPHSSCPSFPITYLITYCTQHMPVSQIHFREKCKNKSSNHMLYQTHKNFSKYSNLLDKPVSCIRRKDWGSRRLQFSKDSFHHNIIQTMQTFVLNRVYRKTIPAGWIWVFSHPSKLNDPSLSKITNISLREHSPALWAPEHFSSTKYSLLMACCQKEFKTQV